MKKLCMVTIVSAGLLLMGCASIVGKTSETITMSSNVDDVDLVVKNSRGIPVYHGTTPTVSTLKKRRGFFSGETYTIYASKNGYTKQVKQLDTGLSGWYWGNIIFGGLVGMLIVDPATGAMWTFDEDTVFFNMEKN